MEYLETLRSLLISSAPSFLTFLFSGTSVILLTESPLLSTRASELGCSIACEVAGFNWETTKLWAVYEPTHTLLVPGTVPQRPQYAAPLYSIKLCAVYEPTHTLLVPGTAPQRPQYAAPLYSMKLCAVYEPTHTLLVPDLVPQRSQKMNDWLILPPQLAALGEVKGTVN